MQASEQERLSWVYHSTLPIPIRMCLSKPQLIPKGSKPDLIHDPCGREAEYLKKNTQGEVIQKFENFYDKSGNRTTLSHTIFAGSTPIKSITHNWEYGPMGRIERFIEAGEKETRYLFDSQGRLKTIIKPSGCKLMHEYDDLGRLSRYFASDFDYHYTYDLSDRVISVYDTLSKSRTSRSYDSLGCIVQESLGNGIDLSNEYDRRGRRVTLILPDASTVNYTYEGIYLYKVSRGDCTHTYSQRNLEGKIIHAQLPAATGEMQIERDALGRYSSLSTPYYTASYPQGVYDGVGNLTHYSYRDQLGKIDCAYFYDDLDQLILENEHTYFFDSLHNRLKKDAYDHAVNSLCQVTDDGVSTYTYDACGNLISDGTRHYTYDSLDRLIAIEEGGKRTEYTYDPFHRRLSKTICVSGRKEQTRYIWDGDNEIGSVDESDYIQELRILGEGLGAEIGAAVLYELKGASYLPIHDHRGCVVALIDLETKKPIECYRYTGFGEELTENTLSPWRFASKRVDEETGLVFFGRRYYHPMLGRWITQDPEGFEDGPNLYAYLHNSPLTDFDPYGLFGWGSMWSGTKGFLVRSRKLCLEWSIWRRLLPGTNGRMDAC